MVWLPLRSSRHKRGFNPCTADRSSQKYTKPTAEISTNLQYTKIHNHANMFQNAIIKDWPRLLGVKPCIADRRTHKHKTQRNREDTKFAISPQLRSVGHKLLRRNSQLITFGKKLQGCLYHHLQDASMKQTLIQTNFMEFFGCCVRTAGRREKRVKTCAEDNGDGDENEDSWR